MNNGPLIFLGIFFALAFSWGGIIMTNHITYGSLEPYFDEATEEMFPKPIDGLAERGRRVYAELGCVYCHTQQVRRPGYGADTDRGWGNRQSVARDYILQDRVFLGTMRTGPDLMTVGQRLPSPEWHYNHFYNPQITSPGSIMPPYPFLFEKRRIVGEPSERALNLPPEFAPPEGYEIVPTPRADALVAYMLSLRMDYDLPEAPTAEQ
ncbi:MAG: cytochrome-c oxidase [Puniceicoccaceae bacterium]|nr:MAG: cytochrome-c oxidase [Puniceicoccaceae bacterium]